jgi:hypothetical protein
MLAFVTYVYIGKTKTVLKECFGWFEDMWDEVAHFKVKESSSKEALHIG